MKKTSHAKVYLLIFVLLFVCTSCDQKNNKSKPKKPNILLLMSDNQSADHLGCYGDTSIKTPHIDKLAKKGLIFKNAYCSAPSCSPARASMLTGQDIWSLGRQIFRQFSQGYSLHPIDGSLWLSRGHRRKRLGPGR